MLLLLSIYVYFKVYLYAISLKQCIFIQYKSTTKLVDFRFTACFYVTVPTFLFGLKLKVIIIFTVFSHMSIEC